MKKRVWWIVVCLLVLSLTLVSCGCEHVDKDDDGYCDECDDEFMDGKDLTDPCQHRDKDDNGKCDTCFEPYTDGKDILDAPVCQHRDVDDNTLCDICGKSYTDGVDITDAPVCQHRDVDDNGTCDKCSVTYIDGKDILDAPVCQHRDVDDNGTCDKCSVTYIDGKDILDAPVCQHRDADDNGTCDKCSVPYTDGRDVEKDPVSVTLDKTKLQLNPGDVHILTATVSPSDAATILTWESSNPAVATVVGGSVIAISEGTAIISVKTENAKAAICVVYVRLPCPAHRDMDDDLVCDTCGDPCDDGEEIQPTVTNVTISEQTLTLLIGGSYTLTAYTEPIAASVLWHSLDESIVTVVNGTVVATGLGTTTVMATVGEISAGCEITVNPIPVESVALNRTDVSGFRYGSGTLTATVYPLNATNQSLIWESSDPNVLMVDENGAYTLVEEGTATITVTSVDGGKIATCDFSVQKGYVIYELKSTNDFYVVKGYAGYEREIEIARIYDGLRVKEIATQAFYNNDNLISITIPNSVEKICSSAFASCDKLETLTLPDGLVTVESDAFRYCQSLSAVTFMGNATDIGDNCFYECPSLLSVLFKDSIDFIGKNAFYNCDALRSVTFMGDVKKIGEKAFFDCGALTSVSFERDVLVIEAYAFSKCVSLPTITLPPTLTRISEGVFKDCENLVSVSLGEGLLEIGKLAFDWCVSLASVDIPDTVTGIGNMAFRHNESLASVHFSEKLISIGTSAFQYCKVLGSVSLPETVKNIGNSAFSYCYGMTDLTILGDIESWGNSAFYECRALEKIDFRSGTYQELTDNHYIFYNAGVDGEGICLYVSADAQIPENIFHPCENANHPKITHIVFENGTTAVEYFKNTVEFVYLQSITVPISVTHMSAKAFYGCTDLAVIMVKDDYHYFGGWYDNDTFAGDAVYPNTYGGESRFLYPKWILYSLTMEQNIDVAGTVSGMGDYAENETVTVRAETNDGYTFLGWYANGEIISTLEEYSFNIDRAIHLVATWEANSYTLAFDAAGGEMQPDAQLVVYNAEYTLPTTERTGYTFLGWFNGEHQYTDGIWRDITDVTLVAHWQANTYNVTLDDTASVITVTYNYNYSGTTATAVTIADGETLSYPTMPTRSGYVFTGWYTSADCSTRYDFTGTIDENMTLYAGWRQMTLSGYTQTQIDPSRYTSSSNSYYCYVNTSSTSSPKTIYLVAQESGTHYLYYRNYTSGSSYRYYFRVYNVTKGTTLQGWTSVTSTSYYGTGFTCSAGDIIAIQCYYYYYSTDAYFYFSGFTAPSSTARADVDEYRYDPDDSFDFGSVVFDSNVTLPTPSRSGYIFDGWYNGEQRVESGAWQIASDVTLTPKWKEGGLTFDTAYILMNGESLPAVIDTAGEYVYFKFTATESKTYTFQSSGGYDTYGYLYDADQTQIQYNDDEGDNNNFKITYSMSAGEVVYLAVRMYSSSDTGTFDVSVS